MSANKTQPTTGDVKSFIDAIPNPRRQADTRTAVDLAAKLTGQPPVLWGQIIGFGTYTYRYASGREGEWMVIGVAPRQAALTLYGLIHYNEDPLLQDLGPHTHGKGCVYIKDLTTTNLDVLGQLISNGYERMRAAGFRFDANDN